MKFAPQTVGKILIAAALLYLFVNPGFRKLVKHEIEKKRISDETARLEKENARLATEIRMLETDDAYYSATVRRELGMIKPGEIEYRLSPRPARRKQ